MKNEIQYRSFGSDLKIRQNEKEDKKYISGYFAVFDDEYEISKDMTESIDRHAFDNALKEESDVRFLIDHKSELVLGRTSNGTGTLKVDDHGLYGEVLINPNDQDALNGYSRVQRGDVNQCSFGFLINKEETEEREDGSLHFKILDLDLMEVSICTFPAYESTAVSARKKDAENYKKRKLEVRKNELLKKLNKEEKEDEA